MIFKSLRRADQRRWAHAYLAGLLITPGKKSVRRLADSVSPSSPAVQSLRQIVSLSPWDWEPVMEEVTRWAEGYGPDPVWTIGRAVLPKRGARSVGVHRYFDLPSGRTLNCQLGLGAFLSLGHVQVPVNWSLHLPVAWTGDPRLRRSARIPDSAQHLPLWAQALRLVDSLTARTAPSSAVVVSDMSDEPDVGHLLHGLGKRGRDFVVAIPQHLAVLPFGEGTPTTPARLTAKTRTPSAGAPEAVLVTTPDGRQRRVQLETSLIHLPGRLRVLPSDPPYRLFTEVRPDRLPGPLWVTNLAHRRLDNVAALAARRTATTLAITSMEHDFGLLDFEGRSFPGWYHHMALVSAAYTYHQLTHHFPAARRVDCSVPQVACGGEK